MSTAIILNSTNKLRKITDERIICADGGFRLVQKEVQNGLLKVDCVIGDADSLTDCALCKDVKRISYPPEKNLTDGELCVDYAIGLGEKNLTFYGVLGGRFDHILGNVALLSRAYRHGATATAKEDGLNLYYVSGEFEKAVPVGTTVSIIPVGGDAVVTDSFGVKYPLSQLRLTSSDARGVSNVTTAPVFGVRVVEGEVLVVVYCEI